MCILSWSISAQDTVHFTGTAGEYWIETYDSVLNADTVMHCLRKDQYYDDTLFSTEYMALDTHNPVSKYNGYYPNGKVTFLRTYHYDGRYCELHGLKELYYQNGNLKEIGLFYHGVKYGNWFYYNSDGTTLKWTQYFHAKIDTIMSFGQFADRKELLKRDTLTTEAVPSFYATISYASFGKNGIEVLYDHSKILEGRVFSNGELMFTENRKFHVKRLIRKHTSFTSTLSFSPKDTVETGQICKTIEYFEDGSIKAKGQY